MKTKKNYLIFFSVWILSIIVSDLWAANTHWQTMSCPINQTLNAIWGRSRTDIFAVGNSGVILHFDGNAWRNQSSPVQTDLFAIWGNDTDIYIVGANGVILKREYQSWIKMISGTENDLLDIWGITESDLVAVGKKGTILRNTSGSWYEMASRTLATLNSVWGTAGPVYACGSGGKLLQMTDNRWNPVTTQTFNTLNAIWGETDQFFYTVGASGIILKNQSGTWSETIYDSFVNLNTIWGFSDGKVFAGGYNGTLLFHDVVRPEWTPMNADTQNTINDLWGTSSQDVYAVGEQGLILHLKQSLLITGPSEVNETDLESSYDIHLVYELNDDLVISMTSSDPTSIDVPEEIVIPAGALQYSFKASILDDIDIDGNTYVTITANAENWYSGTLMVLVVDDEIRKLQLSVPEIASEGNGVINDAGQVSIPGIFDESLTIHLTSDKTDKVIVPGSVEISAGHQTAFFDVTVVDNSIMDGMIPVKITASAPGWQPVTTMITIADNEGAQLSVTVLDNAVENSGKIENSAWVTLASVLLHDFEVILTSYDTSLVEVPYTLIVPAGKTIAMFDLNIKDDNWISGPKSVKIKVEARGWYSGFDTIIIEDNDPRNLFLNIPLTANETDGVLTNTGQITIPGFFTSDLTIELLNPATDRIKTPRYVLLPQGQQSVNFSITVIDNTIISDEISYSLTLTAVSPEWLTASDQMAIIENEQKSLGLWVIENPSENSGHIPHAGTVFIPGTYHQPLTVYLEISNTDRVSIPDQIQIDAGQVSTTFDMTLSDDQEIGEKEVITIIALAPGWESITGVSTLEDDEKKELHLTIPTEATEGDNLLLNAGQIDIPGFYRYDLAISLSVNQGNQIQIPETLFIHAGGTSVLFDIAIIDNKMIDLRQPVTISAQVMGLQGWTEDQSIIHINDNEPKNLELSLISTVSEGYGLYQNIGIVSIPGRFIYDLPIHFTSSNAAIIKPPQTVVIPKGYTCLSFDCEILDNNSIDDISTVTITAFCESWNKQTDTIQIFDDEDYQLSIQMPDQFVEGSGFHKNVAWIIASGIVPTHIPIAMTTSSLADIDIPITVTFPQGSTSVPFDVTIKDNTSIDGQRAITIKASPISPYTRWSTAEKIFDIIDNELTTVSISAPELINEGAGNLELSGMIQILGDMKEPLWVQLTAIPETDIAIPQWITIATGETQRSFDILVLDNNRIEGNQSIQLSANVKLPGWTGSFTEIILEDNDIRQLTISIPETIAEGSGVLTDKGQILLSGTLHDSLKVQLMSGDQSMIVLPQWLNIPEGSMISYFDLTVLDNYQIEGDKSVDIHAYAANFPVVKTQILVLDNDPTTLDLWIPDQATVGDGLLSQMGLVSITGILAQDLTIKLSSSNSEIVSIYQNQIISAGQSMVFFDLYITEQMSDISRLISISAQASGFESVSKPIRVNNIGALESGDFNNDGLIDLKDIITGLQAISGIEQDNLAIYADVNNDGRISLIDVLFVFRLLN
jgi:hypothetical protein